MTKQLTYNAKDHSQRKKITNSYRIDLSLKEVSQLVS